MRAVHWRIQASSAWAGTALWANRIDFAGSMPAGDQRGGHFADVGAQLRGVDVDRQRVEVGEEEQALGLVLHPHPAQDRAEQIAEVEPAGRLDAGDDAHRLGAGSFGDRLSCARRSVRDRFLVDAADQPGDREIDDPADADERAEADDALDRRRRRTVAGDDA